MSKGPGVEFPCRKGACGCGSCWEEAASWASREQGSRTGKGVSEEEGVPGGDCEQEGEVPSSSFLSPRSVLDFVEVPCWVAVVHLDLGNPEGTVPFALLIGLDGTWCLLLLPSGALILRTSLDPLVK